MSSVLVFGSNSFGGASFVDYALEKGMEVIGISRSHEPHDLMLPYKTNKNLDQFTFHKLDINNDFSEIIKIIEQAEPEYVIDFAGQGMVAPSWNWPEQWYQTNIVAKVRLHNVLKDVSFLRRYVRVSTPEVYGGYDTLIDESAPYNPSTPYAVSHAAIDMSLSAFHRQYDFPVVLTRFANFYGAGQQLYRIVPRTIICALSDETLSLQGGGESIRAFIHGYDVADGIYRAMMEGRNGESYHFSTTEFVKIRELVEKISKSLGVPMDDFVKISPDRPGKDHAYLMDSTKAIKELNWKPTFSLDKGVDQTAQWVRENLKTILILPNEYIHQL